MEIRGIGAKHWQQLESGRPITVTTLLRICEALDVKASVLLTDLDENIYEELPIPPGKPKKLNR
jgi:DNA-binding Xre family transcriptional regulator